MSAAGTFTLQRALAALAARRHYALVLGAAFWVLMSARVVVEGGRWTRGGLPVGWDFHIFNSAGRIVADRRSPALYDHAVLTEVAKRILPGDYPVFDYLNPPHFAAPFVAFSPLSHGVAFALFTALNLAALVLALVFASAVVRADSDRPSGAPAPLWQLPPAIALAYALTAYPVVIGLFAGQNCFVSLCLIAAACAFARRGDALLAGALVGALLYKPQLVVGFLVLFVFDPRLRARALLGFAVIAALIALLNVAVFPEASRIYWDMLSELPARHAQFRVAFAFTARAFFELLLPGQPAFTAMLGACTSVASVLAYLIFLRVEPRLALRLAGAVWLSLAVTPHASVYEWTLLLVPLVLLRPALDPRVWIAVCAALLVASYLSPPLAEAMLDRFGFGVQIAIPVFFGAAWCCARVLQRPAERTTHP